MIEVELLWYETALGVDVGSRRQIEALRANRQPHRAARHYGDFERWLIHLNGAGGEIAYAKAFGYYFGGTVNTFHAADIGSNVQVRTRRRHDWDLIVRDEDSDDDVFVHVTGVAPRYRIHGWIKGADAKRPQWRGNYGDHGEAYFVPAVALTPIMEGAHA